MKKISLVIISLACVLFSLQAQRISQSEIIDNRIVVTTESGEKVDYKIYGFCYSVDPSGHQFEAHFDKHLALLKSVYANSIRTYRPLAAYNGDGTINYAKTRQMLDRLADAGLSIAVGFDLNQDLHTGLYKTYLDELGNHPALLCVLLGNEYNYHYIGSAPGWADEWFTKESWLANLADAVKNVKERCNRFVAVVHGEIPSAAELAEYKACGADLVMPNMYRGNSFYDLFEQWTSLTANSLPLVVSEFGRSSVAADGNDASTVQANWLRQLWGEIDAHINTTGAGGYVFELVDEDWKTGANELTGMEKNFGVFTANGTAKPAAELLATLWKGKSGNNTGILPIPVSGLNIYPNPLKKGEALQIETDASPQTIAVYNLSGQLLLRQPTSGTFVEITIPAAEGIYIVKVGNESRKIVVR